MVIDDNQALLQLLQRYLSNHRCQVLTVPNGEKGWALLQETVPDALIMDVMMPELDGWELLQRIRSNSITQGYPCDRLYRVQQRRIGLRARRYLFSAQAGRPGHGLTRAQADWRDIGSPRPPTRRVAICWIIDSIAVTDTGPG